MKRNKEVQIATSLTADFDEKTWTFQFDDDYVVSAGKFALIKEETYMELLEALLKVQKDFWRSSLLSSTEKLVNEAITKATGGQAEWSEHYYQCECDLCVNEATGGQV